MTITSSSVIKKLLVLFLVFAGLHYAKDFIMPLSIAGVFATLFLPLCKWMEGNKIPKGLAVLICLLLIVIAVTGIGALLGWQISGLINDFTLLKQKAIDTADQIQEYIFNHLGISVETQTQILKKEQPSVTGLIQMAAGSLASLLTNFILVLAYIFLLLYYRIHIRDFLLKLTSSAQKIEMEQVIYRASHVSQQYLLGLSKMIVCLWILYSIGFSLIGVKDFLFFAILCGLLEIVPFIGNITGTTLTLLVTAAQGASLSTLGGILCIYGLIQFIQGWILEPLILGPQVKINPLFTVIALVLGGLVWGVSGVFLAIPLTAIFKIICDHIESLKPFGFLIGEIVPEKGESGFIKKLQSLNKKIQHK